MQTSIHHHPSIHVPVRVLGGTGTTGRQAFDRNDCATWSAAFARRVGASGARRLAA